MDQVKEDIEKLFETISPAVITDIEKLPQSGGDRIYFRINTAEKNFIATYSTNLKETETFLYFSKHFKNTSAPVPDVYRLNDAGTIYLQEDVGSISLLETLEKDGLNDRIKDLFKKTLKALAGLQINGDKNLDYDQCITGKEFGGQAILSDLLYFKYYFLDTLKIPYDKEKLGNELHTLSEYLNNTDHKYFMFRDFQSRNVMIKNDEVYFIDYQGGMKGALQYDVASLLWQAKAGLTDEWKNELLDYYIECAEKEIGQAIERKSFLNQYNGYVLIRLLQVLGAYGFRGLFERKAHFLTSIPLALHNLKGFLQNNKMEITVPEFERILKLITTDDVMQRFQPLKAGTDTPLVVRLKSFSFLKTGYPKNVSDNGGGFIFDCRGILNPGRIDEHKQQTGRDKPVQNYLTAKTRMDEFLTGVYSVVDISVEDYIKRNFEHLEINFGCTGGQHRSVYAADETARHLRNKYGVKTEVLHLEQNFADS